jgi:hypothetical protein
MTIKTTVKAGNKTLYIEDFEFIPEVGSSFYAHGTKYIVAKIDKTDEQNAMIQVRTQPSSGARQGGAHAYKTPKGGK